MATLRAIPDAGLPAVPRGGNGSPGSLASRSFLYAVFKHRRLVLGIFLAVFVSSAVAAFLRPPTWLASSRVLVKLGETVQLAPAEAPSRSINLPLNQEVVRTETEIVRSREVVEQAVDRLGISPDPGSSRSQLIEGLRRGLSVQQAPGTNILQISFIGRNPERAARMVNAITDAYIEHHNAVYRREGVHSFYVEQLGLLARQVRQAERRLRDYLKKTGIVDVEQEARLLGNDVIAQEKGLRAHIAKIRATERKVAEVESQLARTPRQIEFAEEYQANPVVEAFKARLSELEAQRVELLQRYMPDDRTVRAVEAQMAEIRARMSREQARVLGRQTLRHNDLYNELQRTLFSLQSLLSDVKAREPALRARLAASKKRLRRLRDRRFVIENLRQDLEQKKYAFDLYWKKHEEARITEAMTNQSVVNVSVVEHAAVPLRPQSGTLGPLLLGLLGGLALATATAVAVEYLNRRLRFEEEVERYLELPVLAVIPDFAAPGELVRA